MKKIIYSLAITFVMNVTSFAQSTTILPTPNINDATGSMIVKKNGIGIYQEGSNGLKIGFYIGSAGGYLQTHTNFPLVFATNDGNPQMFLKQNGNFGIGDNFTTPTARLHVDGFTKLGLDAPAIKTLKFTGTTAATQNASATPIVHGLTASKILSISVVVDLGAAGNVFENYTQSAGYQVGVSFENTLIYIWNSPTNSANILSKPFKVLVTYEE